MNKQTSLTDIAQHAGVSIATVSYALNDSREVSEKTRQKIKKIAQQLNYHPNKAAQGLRNKRSKLICMLINSFHSMFNGELVDHIREELSRHDYSLVVIGDSNSDLIDSHLFDALIIFNYSVSKTTLDQLVANATIPIVVMANELHSDNVENIVIDNRLAIQHLFKCVEASSHKRICFFTNSNTSYNSTTRLQACTDYMQENHPTFDMQKNSFNGKFELKNAYQLAMHLLQSNQYDFFFCLNDMMAYGIYQAANELGLSIGQDISVVGFDNMPKSGEVYKPKLTTVDPRLVTWSQAVVSSLMRRLSTVTTTPHQTFYAPTRIIHGDSVKLTTKKK